MPPEGFLSLEEDEEDIGTVGSRRGRWEWTVKMGFGLKQEQRSLLLFQVLQANAFGDRNIAGQGKYIFEARV